MKLPIELFLQGIDEKKVYYFSSPKLTTSVPHYFICMLKGSNNTVILVCCTSDRDGKLRKRIEAMNLHKALVWIEPDSNNGLTKDTYVDCNNFFEYSIDDFKVMYENDILECKGEISEIHYEQIISGLLYSPTIPTEIKELLRKEE